MGRRRPMRSGGSGEGRHIIEGVWSFHMGDDSGVDILVNINIDIWFCEMFELSQHFFRCVHR